MDYIYTTNGQSGKEENGTMYNGRGLGRKGIGAGRRSSAGCQRSVEGFEGVSKGSKTFRRVQRHFEGFEDISRDVRDFEEASRASKRF